MRQAKEKNPQKTSNNKLKGKRTETEWILTQENNKEKNIMVYFFRYETLNTNINRNIRLLDLSLIIIKIYSH